MLRVLERKVYNLGGNRVITLAKSYADQSNIQTGDTVLIIFSGSYCLVIPKHLEKELDQKIEELKKLLE